VITKEAERAASAGGSRRLTQVLVPSFLLLASFGLVGCGGGETVSDPPVPVTVALSPSQQSITATVMETGAIPTQVLSGVATGDLAILDGATIYVVIEDPASIVSTSSVLAYPDGRFALTLQGRALTAPGRWTGTLTIHASLAPGGRRPLGGSPILVPYDVTVLDPLPLDKTSLQVEAPFGDATPTGTVKATVTSYVTDWAASLGTTEGCFGTGQPLPGAGRRVGCATDGTISVDFAPAAPGTYPETLTVLAHARYGGTTYTVTRAVAITRVVTPNDAIDYVPVPAQLQIERALGDPSFLEQPYSLVLNTGVSATFDGVEYLTSPAGAAGHPQATAWWQELPSGTRTCDVSGATPNCLPEGTYIARLHYLITRNGVQRDAYYPITLQISPSSYFPVTLGSYVDYQFSGSTNRIQVVASSGSAVTTRTTWNSTPGNYFLDDYSLTGIGAYMNTAKSCSVSTSTCSTTYAYAPPEVIFPASTTPGYSETTVSSVTGATPGTYTRTVTVGAVESVVVPAGTFSALKITAHLVEADSYNVTWWVLGVGRVKIVNYPASNPSSTQTWSMSAYGVAAIP
jgi:hypothetical protein